MPWLKVDGKGPLPLAPLGMWMEVGKEVTMGIRVGMCGESGGVQRQYVWVHSPVATLRVTAVMQTTVMHPIIHLVALHSQMFRICPSARRLPVILISRGGGGGGSRARFHGLVVLGY